MELGLGFHPCMTVKLIASCRREGGREREKRERERERERVQMTRTVITESHKIWVMRNWRDPQASNTTISENLVRSPTTLSIERNKHGTQVSKSIPIFGMEPVCSFLSLLYK